MTEKQSAIVMVCRVTAGVLVGVGIKENPQFESNPQNFIGFIFKHTARIQGTYKVCFSGGWASHSRNGVNRWNRSWFIALHIYHAGSSVPPLVRSIWETQRWTVCTPRSLPFPLLIQLLCTTPSQQAGAPAAAGGANMPIPIAQMIIFLSARAVPQLSWANAAPGGCPLHPCLNPPLPDTVRFMHMWGCCIG